ncbi:LOB domain-containing protein 7-like [Canna indica]|uniref:LOB domain-containing protein 7-like n=1 Tax=Canna indica TaxID=4628 RepID=A0AAQ3KLX4_9LILI|nr:LOB domain-containing protein 7-like [Canna indica]
MDSASSRAARHRTCAACRFQRRKCKPNCIFAAFFPADKKQIFENAHRLYDVRNMEKMVEHLDPEQRAEAMKTIIYESEVHAADPIGGCRRIIGKLETELQLACAELDHVRRELEASRGRAQAMVGAEMLAPPIGAAEPEARCFLLTPLP